MIRDLANFRAVIRDLANFLTVIRDLGVPWGASLRKRHVWSFNGMSVSEILYDFMFVGIVLANVIVLADDNWRERQIVPHTIRIFVGCDELKSLTTVKGLKKSIRKWKPTKCPCNLCKIYVAGVGYVVSNE